MPELYFATVRAIGTNLDVVEEALEASLARAGYETEIVHLSDLFQDLPLTQRFLEKDPAASEFSIRHGLMTAGDALRTFVSADAVAQLGLQRICKRREDVYGQAQRFNKRGVAFIIKSLLHKQEVATLRALLGSQLFIVSAFSDDSRRREKLKLSLQRRLQKDQPFDLNEQANDLMSRERGRTFRYEDRLTRLFPDEEIVRLSIDKTFHEADLFVDVDRPETVMPAVDRFVKQLFGYPYGATHEDEAAMAHAFTALAQSSCLARRVGAAVVVDRVVVATGRNDIPTSGGGQFDQRPGVPLSEEVLAEPGASGDERADVLRDAVSRLFQAKDWLTTLRAKGFHLPPLTADEVHEIADAAVASKAAEDSRIFGLIEFNPTVHAEMSAITTAARMGVPLAGGTLYTTTFPCHECTRHIIAAGIKRVVYLEPYPKSRVEALFPGQVVLRAKEEALPGDARVHYEPFIGISPLRHGDLFSWVERKPEKIASDESDQDAVETEIAHDGPEDWELHDGRQLRETIEPRLSGSLLTSRRETLVRNQRELVAYFEEEHQAKHALLREMMPEEG